MFRVADLGVKELLLADERGVYFTTPHFDGYPAVLMRIPDLARIDRDELRDMVVEAGSREPRNALPKHGCRSTPNARARRLPPCGSENVRARPRDRPCAPGAPLDGASTSSTSTRRTGRRRRGALRRPLAAPRLPLHVRT